MPEKKQNKSSIVKNKGVGSEKNTFDGKIQYLPLDQLVDFKNHPFKVEMNTELFELMQSIEKEGVLVPLLARANPAGRGYELIAGHRRKAASKWAGVDKVPVMVAELETFISESGEWGMRNTGESSKMDSNKELARQVGESQRQINRYIRLTYLIPKILDMVADKAGILGNRGLSGKAVDIADLGDDTGRIDLADSGN